MILVIGSSFQGQLGYVLNEFRLTAKDVADGDLIGFDTITDYKVIDKFHLTVKRLYEGGLNIDEFVAKCFASKTLKIIVADEIGSGIVPLEPDIRELRDEIGQILQIIASKSEKVVRICCGLPVVIK